MKPFYILLIFLTMLLSVACTPTAPIQIPDLVDITSEAAASTYFGMEDYGLKISIPESLGLIEAQQIDGGETRHYQFVEKQHGGVFNITLYKNYCNINKISSKYVWGHIRGCQEQEKEHLMKEYGNQIDFDYHVYSSRAIYFKEGSFVSPTLVFSTSTKPKNESDYAKSKSLAYGYRYDKNYYIIELGFSAPIEQFKYNNELLAKLVNAVNYPPSGS